MADYVGPLKDLSEVIDYLAGGRHSGALDLISKELTFLQTKTTRALADIRLTQATEKALEEGRDPATIAARLSYEQRKVLADAALREKVPRGTDTAIRDVLIAKGLFTDYIPWNLDRVWTRHPEDRPLLGRAHWLTPLGGLVLAELAPYRCRRCCVVFNPNQSITGPDRRYNSTPWCCQCVDHCHESYDPGHACPICQEDLDTAGRTTEHTRK